MTKKLKYRTHEILDLSLTIQKMLCQLKKYLALLGSGLFFVLLAICYSF